MTVKQLAFAFIAYVIYNEYRNKRNVEMMRMLYNKQ